METSMGNIGTKQNYLMPLGLYLGANSPGKMLLWAKPSREDYYEYFDPSMKDKIQLLLDFNTEQEILKKIDNTIVESLIEKNLLCCLSGEYADIVWQLGGKTVIRTGNIQKVETPSIPTDDNLSKVLVSRFSNGQSNRIKYPLLSLYEDKPYEEYENHIPSLVYSFSRKTNLPIEQVAYTFLKDLGSCISTRNAYLANRVP